MGKVTQSETDNNNYEEYENVEDEFESMPNRDQNRDKNSWNRNIDHSTTYGNNFNPRIENVPQMNRNGGNYYDRVDDRRNSNPNQFPYPNHNNFDNRNNFHANQNQFGHNSSEGHRNNSNDSNDMKKDRACILQCFFQEMQMVRKKLIKS